MKKYSRGRIALALSAVYLVSTIGVSGYLARHANAERESDALPAANEDDREPTPSDSKQAAAREPVAPIKPDAVPPKFDPIFVGWPKPDLALVISGRQDGYLEPCGCAGLENQKGGMSRRHALIKLLAKRGWNVLPIDVGGQVRRFGKQAELQFGISVEALQTMGYRAVGFGADDLRLSAGEVAAAVAGAAPPTSIFVSANVSLFDKGAGVTPRYRIVEAAGFKLGITSVLGPTYQAQVNNADVIIEPAEQALKEVLPELKECNIRILLAYATLEETKKLAQEFPKFDLVVTADDRSAEPPNQPAKIEGTRARLVELGHKGMFVQVVGIYGTPKKAQARFQRVPLDARFSNSVEMKQLMRTYQSQLQNLGWQGLGLKPAAHPGGQFVGAAACKKCHESPWDVWQKSKHAHATETLVKLDPPRQFDPECVSCHVTGWNAHEFYPYKSGYLSVAKTPKILGNGCENCHGPAAAHVAAEAGHDEALQQKFRSALHLATPTKEDNTCIKCHDLDNSPNFSVEKYWEEIAH